MFSMLSKGLKAVEDEGDFSNSRNKQTKKQEFPSPVKYVQCRICSLDENNLSGNRDVRERSQSCAL